MLKYIQQYIVRLFALSFILYLMSCKKTNDQENSLNGSLTGVVPVSVILDPASPSYAIAPDYLGLSFEMSEITDSNYFNPDQTVFIQLIKNLSPGILRIGANSVDKTFWSGKPRLASTPPDSITTSDIDRFSLFLQAIQWKTIFGLNLGGLNNPTIASNEAVYVKNDLSGLLQSFEVGNEADLYPGNGYRNAGYSITNFNSEWEAYDNAVKTSLPDVIFSGPAFAYNRSWLAAFAEYESKKINELTIHYYQSGPSTDPSININTLLDPSADEAIDIFAADVASIATGAQVPYRVAECNSIYDGGKMGVSDTFGATLWAIDFMWQLAYSGCTGINFHGGGNGLYSPIGEKNGNFFAKPEYYSMLFFKNGASGNILPCKINTGNENVSVYASKSTDGTLYVTVVNKEPQTNVAVSLQTGLSTVHSVTLSSLTAPSLEATESISLEGYSLQTDGSIVTSLLHTYTVNQPSFTVNVTAASAMNIIIR
jgi:Glycosyl hydrolase family 79, N-terminal domain